MHCSTSHDKYNEDKVCLCVHVSSRLHLVSFGEVTNDQTVKANGMSVSFLH